MLKCMAVQFRQGKYCTRNLAAMGLDESLNSQNATIWGTKDMDK